MDVEQVSKAVFGSRHRLPVALAVAGSDLAVVFAKQIADDSGVAPNIVGDTLKRFAAAGLLVQVNEHVGGGERVLYERTPSVFWELCRALAVEVAGEASRPS